MQVRVCVRLLYDSIFVCQSSARRMRGRGRGREAEAVVVSVASVQPPDCRALFALGLWSTADEDVVAHRGRERRERKREREGRPEADGGCPQMRRSTELANIRADRVCLIPNANDRSSCWLPVTWAAVSMAGLAVFAAYERRRSDLSLPARLIGTKVHAFFL